MQLAFVSLKKSFSLALRPWGPKKRNYCHGSGEVEDTGLFHLDFHGNSKDMAKKRYSPELVLPAFRITSSQYLGLSLHKLFLLPPPDYA